MLAKRSIRRCRATWTMMYSATRPKTTSRNRKNHAWAKPDSVIGPSHGSVITDPSWCVRPYGGRRASLATRQCAAAAGFDKTDDVGDPIPVGAQRQQRRSTTAHRAGHIGAMRRGGLGEVIAQLLVDGELAGDTGFGVLQDDVADVGQLDVAGIEHFDAQHFMARGDGPQRTHPVDWAEEVTDDHGHPTAPFRTP